MLKITFKVRGPPSTKLVPKGVKGVFEVHIFDPIWYQRFSSGYWRRGVPRTLKKASCGSETQLQKSSDDQQFFNTPSKTIDKNSHTNHCSHLNWNTSLHYQAPLSPCTRHFVVNNFSAATSWRCFETKSWTQTKTLNNKLANYPPELEVCLEHWCAIVVKQTFNKSTFLMFSEILT